MTSSPAHEPLANQDTVPLDWQAATAKAATLA